MRCSVLLQVLVAPTFGLKRISVVNHALKLCFCMWNIMEIVCGDEVTGCRILLSENPTSIETVPG